MSDMMAIFWIVGFILAIALVRAPFKLYSIDSTLKEILKELRKKG